MERDTVLRELLGLIDMGVAAESLTSARAAQEMPGLVGRAEEAFGTWDALLAQAVVRLRRRGGLRSEAAPAEEPPPKREVAKDADRPILVLGSSGQLFTLGLDALPVRSQAAFAPFPQGPVEEQPRALQNVGRHPTLALFTARGNGLALDRRILPRWSPDTAVRPLSERFFGLAGDEVLRCGLTRRSLERHALFFSVSTGGLIKPTPSAEYARLSTTAMTAFLIREGDDLFTCFTGERDAQIVVASSHGKALLFEASTLRPQGRKAGGVRAIALEPEARVAGAFVAGPDQELALVTERGLIKRFPLDELRPQGRGGAGLQTCRLNPGDRVAAFGPVPLDGDVVLLTSRGRVARMPAWSIPRMGRSAKGNSVARLEPEERVVGLLGVVAGELTS